MCSRLYLKDTYVTCISALGRVLSRVSKGSLKILIRYQQLLEERNAFVTFLGAGRLYEGKTINIHQEQFQPARIGHLVFASNHIFSSEAALFASSSMAIELDNPVPEGFIRLVSGDGFSFTVDEDVAMVSTVLKRMMKSEFKEARTRIVNLPHIKGQVLEKVCQYFYYIPRFNKRQELVASASKASQSVLAGEANLYSFNESFDIPPELSIEIYLAARYLEL